MAKKVTTLHQMEMLAEKVADTYDPATEQETASYLAVPDGLGSPLFASTAASMTDTDKIYVYMGNEQGYANGHWYYYDGSAWTDGGAYYFTGFETDATLTQENVPADAKETGDAIRSLQRATIITDTISGDIAIFQDGADYPAQELIADINAVQDLHGYDAPWPAGGGENLLPFEEVLTEGWTNTQDGITATYSHGIMHVEGTNTSSGFTNIVSFNTVFYNDDRTLFGPGDYIMSDHLVIPSRIDGGSTANKGLPINATTSLKVNGFYIAVNGGATVDWYIPMMFIRGATRPNAYKPYANICPISGWTGANIGRTRKNLLPNITAQGGPTFVMLGQEAYYSTSRDVTLPAGTFIVSATLDKAAFLYYRNDDNTVSGRSSKSTAPSLVITNGKPDRYAFWLYLAEGMSTEDVLTAQIELGSTATDYEPYVGTIYPVSWQTEAGTVYGGEVNVTTGVLTVTHKAVDMAVIERNAWTKSSLYKGSFYVSVGDSHIKFKTHTPFICSHASTVVALTNYTFGKCFCDSSVCLWLLSDPDATVDDFLAYLQAQSQVGTPVLVCGELATPVTYQLTPIEIETLVGNNIVWADTGDVSITYAADTKLYINKKISEAIANLS